MLAVTFLSAVGTISPGFAVPDASTTSLVLPEDGGLNGAGPDVVPASSHGFGGRVPAEMHANINSILLHNSFEAQNQVYKYIEK